MQAIILAAGMGKRLGELTSQNTKCMLEVNGIRLIDRVLGQLNKLDLSRIVIVIGYQGEKLRNYLLQKYPFLPLVFVENPIYDKTNNIYSLWLAREYMAEEDTLLLESDLIFEDAVLYEVVHSKYRDCALVAKYQSWMDGTMVRINADNNIVNFISKKAFNYAEVDSYYKTVNIYKFSREFIVNTYLPFLKAYIQVLGENEYYEQVLRVITLIDGAGIKALSISGKHWYEIDDVQDLRIAEAIFAAPEERLKKIEQSLGGYWRYPSLQDFSNLTNPFFPTQRMVEEMKANFEILLRNSPSGMTVNSLLGSKYYSLRQDYVFVGNGVAELIKSLLENVKGNVGVVMPTLDDAQYFYENPRVVAFNSHNEDLSYSVSDLIDFYTEHKVESLFVVNPDNPSGNMIGRRGLIQLLEWTRVNGIRLIIDESYADFADDWKEITLLHDDILHRYSHLCVLKSISGGYGVAGLCLGILASADMSLIERIRKDVGVRNINSFAEFYMQIYGKYENEYFEGCNKLRKERDIFMEELKEIPYLRVIPSQANYFLCEVTDRFTSYDLTLKLLNDYNILIKDCSAKEGFPKDREYIRIAIRDREANNALYRKLKSLSEL